MPLWLPSLDSVAPQILLSTSVTIARNIQGLTFPPFRGHSDQAEEAHLLAYHALKNLPVFMNALVFNTADLTTEQKRIIGRRAIAPKEFLASSAYRTLMVTPDESVIARINNQNHIEILLRRPGNCPQQLTRHAMGLMKQLDDSLDFAKDPEFGYICTNLEQIGNGMRIQIFAHLPALELRDYSAQTVNAARELNFLLEYGFSTPQKQDALLYKLRTRTAYSEYPDVQAKRLGDFAKKLENHELDVRHILLDSSDKGNLLDFIGRARGLVNYAHRLSLPESRRILSACWLGAEMGLLPEETRNIAIRLLAEINGDDAKQDENTIASTIRRRESRAQLFRNTLAKYLK